MAETPTTETNEQQTDQANDEYDINSLIPEYQEPEAKEEAPAPDATGEELPTEEKADAAETPPPSPQHPDWLLKKAAAYGISEVEANRYPAETLLDHFEKVAATRAANQAQQQPPNQTQEPDELDELLNEDYDDNLRNAIKSVRDKTRKLEQQLAESQEQVRRQNAERLQSDVEKWIGELPEAAKKQLDPQELFALMHGIHSSANQIGKNPTVKQVFDRAVRSLYDLPAAEKEAAKEGAELERRKGVYDQVVERPTQRISKQPPAKGDAAAKAFVDNWRKEHGFSQTEEEKDILAGLPD